MYGYAWFKLVAVLIQTLVPALGVAALGLLVDSLGLDMSRTLNCWHVLELTCTTRRPADAEVNIICTGFIA